MSNEAKLLRKQLHNIVKELMPALLTEELKSVMYAELTRQLNTRVDTIAKTVKETLDKIDERSKDVLGYAVRQSAISPNLPNKEIEKNETQE